MIIYGQKSFETKFENNLNDVLHELNVLDKLRQLFKDLDDCDLIVFTIYADMQRFLDFARETKASKNIWSEICFQSMNAQSNMSHNFCIHPDTQTMGRLGNLLPHCDERIQIHDDDSVDMTFETDPQQ